MPVPTQLHKYNVNSLLYCEPFVGANLLSDLYDTILLLTFWNCVIFLDFAVTQTHPSFAFFEERIFFELVIAGAIYWSHTW